MPNVQDVHIVRDALAAAPAAVVTAHGLFSKYSPKSLGKFVEGA
jgi:hypothetical protein